MIRPSERVLAWLEQPLAAAAVSLLFAVVVVGVRVLADGGDVSRLVRASPPFADASRVPPGLTVADDGYDGMFYYRLALDPFTTERTADGITLDLPAYRQQRIAYPLLAWAASGGDPSRVPLALVGVNVIGLAAVGLLGAGLARTAGRHPMWGLLFSFYPGFVLTLTRDLTEIVAAVAVLAALLLLRRGRKASGALALALAVLSRETTVVLAAAAGIARFLGSPRRARAWAPFLLPGIVLVGMQLALAERWQAAAANEATGALDPPFLGLLVALWADPQRWGVPRLAAWLVVIAFVGLLVSTGAAVLRSGGAAAHEPLAWWLYALLATVLEVNIWATGAILRALTELGMLTCLLALAASARWRWSLLVGELIAGLVLLAAGPAL